MCRQVVGLYYTSLGIENVGESDAQVLDDAGQYRAALRLTRGCAAGSASPSAT
jgi:hypothetical protein